jgi:hypothetical protein
MSRKATQCILLLAAMALLAFAIRCDERWFELHVFLPQQLFIVADRRIVLWARASAAALAMLLLLLAPRASGRQILLGAVLSVLAAEGALQWKMRHLLQRELVESMQALTSPHPRYGVTLNASMDRRVKMGGRDIRWITDADRRRISGKPVDGALPSLVVIGESTATGAGLRWDETFAAILGARLRLQVVDLGSMNYRIDQSLLRLRDQLPALERPVAVVGVFLPGLLGRMRRSGPHERLALHRLWRHLYWSGGELREAMGEASASLQQIYSLASSSGASTVFVVTGHTPDWMRRELFERPGLPHVVVEIPDDELLSEGHPGPRGSERIAEAVALRLRNTMADRSCFSAGPSACGAP